MVTLPSALPPEVTVIRYCGRVGAVVVVILGEEVFVEDDFSFEVFFCANANEAVKLLTTKLITVSIITEPNARRVVMENVL
jgi:hypothetical protein